MSILAMKFNIPSIVLGILLENPFYTYRAIIADHENFLHHASYQTIIKPCLFFHILHTCLSGHSKPKHYNYKHHVDTSTHPIQVL